MSSHESSLTRMGSWFCHSCLGWLQYAENARIATRALEVSSEKYRKVADFSSHRSQIFPELGLEACSTHLTLGIMSASDFIWGSVQSEVAYMKNKMQEGKRRTNKKGKHIFEL